MLNQATMFPFDIYVIEEKNEHKETSSLIANSFGLKFTLANGMRILVKFLCMGKEDSEDFFKNFISKNNKISIGELDSRYGLKTDDIHRNVICPVLDAIILIAQPNEVDIESWTIKNTEVTKATIPFLYLYCYWCLEEKVLHSEKYPNNRILPEVFSNTFREAN
jgi:hypothetical protein